MSYVDAWFDRNNDVIKVVERNKKGEREFRDIPVRHTFYYKDARGKYLSIYGDALSKVVVKSTKELRKEQAINSGKQLFESDINPIFVTLSENYLNADAPKLNVAFFDIEVDFDPERGYSTPDDAFMPITAIAVHLQWLETMVCLAVPPKTLTMEEAKAMVEEFPNTMLFKTEAEMLDVFLDLIKEADILTGWNSEGLIFPILLTVLPKH
jgi:DNA polymerase elongation subunit (family B)